MDRSKSVRVRLDEADERTHPIEAAKSFNESMYVNVFDHAQRVGGWFRVGNRPNEGRAEVSVCVYLPGGRVAFAFERPEIRGNDALAAAGLAFEVTEPFRRMRVTFEGELVVLDDPQRMDDPKQAFATSPRARARIAIDFEGVSPMYGGEAVDEHGAPVAEDPEEAFARGHYEQHVAGRGTISVGEETLVIDGLGLRDHSWGPRYWQNLHYYRWLPMSFSRELAMNVSVVTMTSGKEHVWGMVLRDGRYEHVERATITSTYDAHAQARTQHITLATEDGEYEVTGRALSLIPLRNRRATDDGAMRTTRITEAFTEYRMGHHVGYGMAEYLDQIVDGRPVGVPR